MVDNHTQDGRQGMGTYDTQKSKRIGLSQIIEMLKDKDCSKFYVKKLAPNDNSKNQPYFGSHLTDLPFLPTQEVIASTSTSNKTSDPKRKIKYQAALNLSWIDAEGHIYGAPNAKLIYYPQYPEVRFSGFLLGSSVDASEWMSPDKQGRSEGRWLILGTIKNTVLAYLVTPESDLSRELSSTTFIQVSGVFGEINLEKTVNKESTREALIDKLREIHQEGGIPSQKLTSDMKKVPYKARNGGGYTLESRLGIAPNGIAEPDYLGWEVKQFGVTRFPRIGSKPTTLMTPEPNGGYYTDKGVIEFIRSYGYPDKSGIVDRLNFGGKHVVGHTQKLTSLTLKLQGFDTISSTITDAEGSIVLLDTAGNVTASWSFAKLMNHWKRKHSQAVYIPCLKQEIKKANKEIETFYHYGKDIELGTGTSFELILSAMDKGTVFYDPGIKLEQASSPTPKSPKRRNQFRTNHKHIGTLYKKFEFIDVENP